MKNLFLYISSVFLLLSNYFYAQTGKNKENNKDLFLGTMHSTWAKFEYSLLPVAEANWTGKTILKNLKF